MAITPNERLQRVRGTADNLDLSYTTALLKTISDLLTTHNFTPIATPIIEQTDLFVRSLGTETDVVSKEMYLIERKTETSEAVCLRPESTASTIRAFVENKVEQRPWKTFQYGPMFRYERPQKGRFRQFHQLNIEVVDAPSFSHDIQFLVMLDAIWKKLGITNHVLAINFIGTLEDRKIHREKLLKFLAKKQSYQCQTCLVRVEKNLLRIFDCKNQDCQTLYKNAPKITECLSEQSQQDWQKLQDTLQMLSINFVHNPLLVRGLDYYYGLVFEFVSSDLGAQNAFCGGGRYDLAQTFGLDQTIPSLGAAIGMERLVDILQTTQSFPAPQKPKLHVILPMSEAQHVIAQFLGQAMTRAGLCVEILFDGSMKTMMRKANKIGAATALIIGEDEQKTESVMVKNMITGEGALVKQADVVETLRG